mgnify:CR=1 FL=1
MWIGSWMKPKEVKGPIFTNKTDEQSSYEWEEDDKRLSGSIVRSFELHDGKYTLQEEKKKKKKKLIYFILLFKNK